jgi:hypothetical protein
MDDPYQKMKFIMETSIFYKIYPVGLPPEHQQEQFLKCLNHVILRKTNIGLFNGVEEYGESVLTVSAPKVELEKLCNEMKKAGFEIRLEQM